MASTFEDSITTRYSLLSRLQDWDDQDSWRCFFDRYWKLIYAVALRSGLSDPEAQDVVQETVICVAKNIHSFKRDRAAGSFKGWLMNLTRWRIVDQFRKRRLAETSAGEEAAAAVQSAHVDGELENLWDAEWNANLMQIAVERVRARVREEHYQIFDLAVFHEWPAGKIASALGVNIGKVYLAKHRVTAEVQAELRALSKELH